MKRMIGSGRWSFALVLFSMLAGGFASYGVSAQGQEAMSNCALNGKVYTCDPVVFRRALKRADTVSIEYDAQDNAARVQLRELATSLGKHLVSGASDLIFVIRPAAGRGLSIGPSDVDLATLRIYSIHSDGSQRELLWSETYRGQADKPWPIIVHSLIQQFQEKLK